MARIPAGLCYNQRMSAPVLATKLFIPQPRSGAVLRPHLIGRLNEGLRQNQGFGRKLTLISAPAGFGKTTLIGDWVAGPEPGEPGVRFAWLSLDEGDSDPARFLAYLIAALRTVAPAIGEAALAALHAAQPQPPPAELILTSLLNDLAGLPDNVMLVLDDYHVVDAGPVDRALIFLVEHLPPRMHLVIASREDPQLPLARLRAQGQLTELRAADLRFTPAEAAEFLNRVMGLALSAEHIATLQARTEGWVAGLQLAALALQGQFPLQGAASAPGHEDAGSFMQSFTGSHRFVMDYLMEEVLQRQPPDIQAFLLRTSILDRLCGPLCDAVCACDLAGQGTLEYLERANLFIVPLDNERRWYRYHHLFADLLRQRLGLSPGLGAGTEGIAELHRRASQWYEDQGHELEAFQQAVAAGDVERAARLAEGRGQPGKQGMARMPGMTRMPLQFRGALAPVLQWLASLPAAVLDARPALWVMYASVLSMTGRLAAVEPKLQAAERALARAGPPAYPAGQAEEETRNLIGHIAAIRALLAAGQNQVETIIAQSQRALEYLHPDNLAVRTATIWKLGIAYQLQGERAAAARSYTEAISISQASGNLIINMAATTGLAYVQETQNQLHLAAETYGRVLALAGDPGHPATGEAHLGLARICYEWNDLPAAEQHARQSLQLARQYGNAADRSVLGEIVLARAKLARGDAAGAVALLAQADQSARSQNVMSIVPEVATAQVRALLRLGNLAAAAQIAHDVPLSQARVLLAQGHASAALAVLEPLCQQAEAKCWEDERLKVLVLQALAYQADGHKDRAALVLGEALVLAEPAGCIRSFVDEGLPMAQLLSEVAAGRVLPGHPGKLLAAFEAEQWRSEGKSDLSPVQPLSQRELEILQLIAQGLSNHEIGERLFLALDTVKGHNRRIYDKLQVERRTEAVARARELGIL